MNNRNRQGNKTAAKIVHLLPGLGIGGCERIVLNLNKAFDPALFDSTILYWLPQPTMLDAPVFQDLRPRVHKLELPKVASSASVHAISQYLKRSKTALLHTHLMDADLLGFFAAKFRGLPHVATIHSYPFPFLKRHCLRYKTMSLFGTHLVCVSEMVKKHVAAMTGIGPGKISVIHNGVDLSHFTSPTTDSERKELRRQFGCDEHTFIVGYISRVIEKKGHEFLLDAVPQVIERCGNALFLIVGDGNLRGPLIARAKQLGIGAHVFFTGSRTDIPELLSIMDVYICPSLHESFGLSVIEAMAAAKPIIASNMTVIPELIAPGKNGIIVPLRDAAAIADAIIDLFKNPGKRKTLAQAAFERAHSFSLEKAARSLEDLYRSLLNKGYTRLS